MTMIHRLMRRLSRVSYARSNRAIKHDVRRLSRIAYARSNRAIKHDVLALR